MENIKRYSLFLGCVIPNRYPFIEKATRSVFKKLGIEIVELEGASCCSAPGVFKSFDMDSWLLTAARNLTLAEDVGADIAVMCNGCYGTLLEASHILNHDKKKLEFVNTHLAKIGREYKGTVKVKHVMEIYAKELGAEKIRKTVRRKKSALGLNVAVHYGCHLLKPGKIRPWEKEVEDPRFFDELVEATGCKSIDYRDKLMCCGAGGGVRTAKKLSSLKFTLDKLKNIREAKADVIVTACPFCHLQFDLGQLEINSYRMDPNEPPFKVPVMYYSQLLGLALGLTLEDVGLKVSHELTGVPPFTSIAPVVTKLGEKIEG